MKKTITAFLTTIGMLGVHAQQVVTTIPTFIDPSDSVVIIVDLNQMDSSLAHVQNLKDDAKAGLDVYVWTWRPREHQTGHPRVNGLGAQAWKNSNDALKMTKVGSMLYRFTFGPTLIDWYATDTATAYNQGLAFLVKPKDGGGYGDPDRKSEDIVIPIPRPGLNISMVSHPSPFYFAGQNDVINLQGQSSINANLSISVNGTSVATANGVKNISHILNMSSYQPGLVEVVLSATAGVNTTSDTIQFLIRGNTPVQAIPAGRQEGIAYPSNSSVYLQLRAPGKNFIYVIGDFNNWTPNPTHEMKKSPDGQFFWIELTGLTPGQAYRFQYFIDDAGLRIADPFSELILDPRDDQYIPAATYPNLLPYPHGKTTEVVGVLEPGKTPYAWDNSINYTRPDEKNLIIYELLIRDWDVRRSFQSVIDRLDYLEKLGINAIQLMPINEFEGNNSWGYNPMFMCAVDKYYGTREKFKELVEECHRRGIAVILDIVLNHQFGQSPLARLYNEGGYGNPTSDNPWFNVTAKHDFNVGYDFNHESQATKYFSKEVIKYWLEEYRIDGYRFDLSKGFTQNNTLGNVGAWGAYDQNRINILQDYANAGWSVAPGAYMILEHFANNDEETELSNRGFMLWGNLNHEFNEASMSFTSNLNWGMASSRGWQNNRLVTYAESHDEERIMYKNLQFGRQVTGYNIRSLNTALERAELMPVFLMPMPGPKMIWAHGELGYDISIDDPCRICEKAVLWNYLNVPERREVFRIYQLMHKLKTERSHIFDNDPTFRGLNAMLKFYKFENNGDHLLIYGNFDVNSTNVQPFFPVGGWWYDLTTGDSLNVVDVNMTIAYNAGEYHVYSNRRWFVQADIPIGIDEPNFSVRNTTGLTVGPNPFNDEVNFYLADGWNLRNAELTILNTLGQVIYSGKHEINSARFTWNATELEHSQLYIYQVKAGNHVYSGRLIRNRQ